MFQVTNNDKQFQEDYSGEHVMEQLLIQDELRFSELPPIKSKYDLEEVLSHFEKHNDIPTHLIDEEGLGYILSNWNNIKAYPNNPSYRKTKNIVERWC